MRKTHKKLSLKTNIVRSLDEASLTGAAGGLATAGASCLGTCFNCPRLTPHCPM